MNARCGTYALQTFVLSRLKCFGNGYGYPTIMGTRSNTMHRLVPLSPLSTAVHKEKKKQKKKAGQRPTTIRPSACNIYTKKKGKNIKP
jgi:hypothetical protein